MPAISTFASLEDLHSFQNLQAEMKLTAGGDPWGWCKGWWFAIAGRLHDLGGEVPADWHYRPSPLGGVDLDAYEDRVVAQLEITPPALIYAGNLMDRYARACRHKGLNY
ncbi:MAG: hypothetical protein KME20_26900 [Kaiparowitsia implicata GSE-PSE-MK54-09C]|jgi:hypothetical protein|nr:hypothetical protein [Kaiparowitsia implicata GSE-PSE-MK54-09C]